MLENLEDQKLQSAFMSSKIMQQTSHNSFLNIDTQFKWQQFYDKINRYACEGKWIVF